MEYVRRDARHRFEFGLGLGRGMRSRQSPKTMSSAIRGGGFSSVKVGRSWWSRTDHRDSTELGRSGASRLENATWDCQSTECVYVWEQVMRRGPSSPASTNMATAWLEALADNATQVLNSTCFLAASERYHDMWRWQLRNQRAVSAIEKRTYCWKPSRE